MNREAINAAISAWFEPKPSFNIVPRDTSSYLFSAKRAYNWDGIGKWRPRDYFTDESANARLRYAMFVRVNTPDLLQVIGEDQWITIQRDVYSFVHRRFDDGASLENLFMEAWVRQFCKFAGIEAGGVK